MDRFETLLKLNPVISGHMASTVIRPRQLPIAQLIQPLFALSDLTQPVPPLHHIAINTTTQKSDRLGRLDQAMDRTPQERIKLVKHRYTGIFSSRMTGS